jgi:nucleotide-binding universal stress UspA family protein
MVRSIVVPLDGSTFAEHALPMALGLARRSGASLQVVLGHTAFVYAETGLVYDEALDRQLREQEQSYLEAVVQRARDVAPVRVNGTLRDGPAVDAICDEVTATSAELIIMATHGRGPFSRFWLGSVADELVRQKSVPVLLVRPEDTSPDLAQEPVLRHILIPLDGSPLAEQVLDPAVALGQLLGADFTLLRIVRPALFPGHDPTRLRDPAPGQPATERMQADALAYLEGVAERLRAQSLRVQTRVAVATQPAVAILREQDLEPPHGLIALATRGHGGVTRTLLGSVADKVVRGATTPVLVYKPVRG